ncbi:TetR/AcrR family transcriptional regulator [Litoribrevibacter euphylliae]|uniref:TetR/AcrR family transcriptional regulator n=1 Tax=Litoribrevibacter euphylliae TaxID=1834034 RepID=A0ABV7HFI5_9GAMM
MARRFDHSSEEITDMALQWVKHHLQSDLSDSLSLRKVAKGIGYSPGTLINLFGSYGYLLLRVNADTLDELSEQMKAASTNDTVPEQQLNAMALCYLEFAMAHTQRWRLIFELKLATDEDIPDWQQQRIDQLLNQVKGLLTGIKPDASNREIEQTARIMWAGVHGISFLAVEDKLFSPAKLNHSEMVTTLIRNYLTGWLSDTESR